MYEIQMPANPTAWLRDNARHGATLITKAGTTRAYLGVKVTYTDPDRGTEQRPLFAPIGGIRKAFTDTSTKPQLD